MDETEEKSSWKSSPIPVSGELRSDLTSDPSPISDVPAAIPVPDPCLLHPSDSQVALEWMAVLSSQRIRYEVLRDGERWQIRVRRSGQLPRALREIEAYEKDREYFRRCSLWRMTRFAPSRFRRSDFTLVMIFVLAVFYGIVGPAGRWNPLGNAGAMDVLLFRNGEWWRAVTALTLHADLPHLVGNLGFLFLFMTPVCHVFGAGSAWLLLLVAAACGNVATVALYAQGEAHSSVGASTAVFAALGILAASRIMPAIWDSGVSGISVRPVLAAIGILALTGLDPSTDIAAHVMGFASGFVFSTLAWICRIPDSMDRKWFQTVCVALFSFVLVAAWSLAAKIGQPG